MLLKNKELIKNLNVKNQSVIIYLGAFRFPDQDAAAKRVLGIAHILNDIGYKVVFAGGETGEKSKQTFQNFDYYSQSELDAPTFGFTNKLRKFFASGKNTIQWLQDFKKDNRIEKVIIYNSSAIYINKIRKFCKKNNIEVIADITEWYDSSHLPGGKYGPVGIDNWFKMNYIYKTIPKHIVISHYLKNFYKNKISIVVPPLIIPQNDEVNINNDARKNIIYVGSPGKKDNLSIAVDGYLSDVDKFRNIGLVIAGITEKEYSDLYGKVLPISHTIIFTGRVEVEEVAKLYKSASFSFFLRPNERYANAGFPTKFVESLSFGVPVITTPTSDLKHFLINEENGFLLESLSQQSFIEILEKINAMSPEENQKMKEKSLITSKLFHYREHIEDMKEFLK